jgi:predicted HAD superfamily phosphohydrolase YqeG
MRHRNRPFALANSIFEIEPSFYRSLGITTVLVDLDNTLDPYTVSDPTERTIKWKESLIALGLRIVILSNNSGKRVRRYAEKLGVECRCFMRKPFSGPLKKFLVE